MKRYGYIKLAAPNRFSMKMRRNRYRGQSGARSGLCHGYHANGVRLGTHIPYSEGRPDLFRLFKVTNSQA